MSKILLSIKPEYAHKILEGTKKYEFRKHLPKKKIEKIIIYSTAPDGSVIGEFAWYGVIRPLIYTAIYTVIFFVVLNFSDREKKVGKRK